MRFLAEEKDVIIEGVRCAKDKVYALTQVYETVAQATNFCNMLIDTVMCERGVAVELHVLYKKTENTFLVKFTRTANAVQSVKIAINKDFGTKAFFIRFVEGVAIWLQEYMQYLQASRLANAVNNMLDKYLENADIAYTVKWCVGTDIMFIDDTVVMFGASVQQLQYILNYLEVNKNDTLFVETLQDTFKLCVTPIELLRINNEITQALGIYKRVNIYKQLRKVYTKRFIKATRGDSLLRTDDFVTVIRATAATQEEVAMLPQDLYYICENERPLVAERTRKQDYIVYSYVVKPVGNYCVPVNCSLESIVKKYKPTVDSCVI